jgi:acetate kinase
VLIDDDVYRGIVKAADFAPLHNPANLLGIDAIAELMPELDQVAVFDTAFHQTMPAHAYRYAVPKNWYKEHGVRRYGMHGTSYRFITEKLASELGKPVEKVNAVIAHLGSGASLAAIKNGKSVDTTMGFTPLEGVSMGTRSGDLDAGVIPYIMEKEGLSIDEILTKLNKESGHKGVSGISDDMRDLEMAVEADNNEDATLAIEIFAHRCAKYIAGLMTSLDELDALVFTAGVGENGAEMREKIVEKLALFGFKVDGRKNLDTRGFMGKEGLISSEKSKYPIYVLGTNEELMIARDTAKITRQKN